MSPRLGRVRLAISTLRLLPHLLLLRASSQRPVILADVARWCEILFTHDSRPPRSHCGGFIRLMSWHPEFRNLCYYRLGPVARLLQPLCRPLPTLYITSPQIGPGLYIQHGFATIISAHRIGRDCWINQQVTIGYSNGDDAPTLGDRVVVNAGAKVIGAVQVGDDVRIGANAVVVKDVPPNVTVVGVPARIVRRDGRRVEETP